MTMFYAFIIRMKEGLYDVSNLLKTNVKLLIYLVFTLSSDTSDINIECRDIEILNRTY